jgi:hypothetical protein
LLQVAAQVVQVAQAVAEAEAEAVVLFKKHLQ